MSAERKPDRRRALIEAAYARLANGGFERLRTRDVASDAGVNIATLHYYFPSKEALIRGVVAQALQRFYATLRTDGSAVDQLCAHLRSIADLLAHDQQLWAVLCELVLRAPRDPELAELFRQSDAQWQRTLSGLLQQCLADGAIHSALDPDGAARLMIAAIKGLSLPTVGQPRAELVGQVFMQFERLLDLRILEERRLE